MVSFSTIATLDDPVVSRGDRGGTPPIFRDGGRGGNGPGAPDYATRLRRARLGLFVALIPVLMLFVSFTSAYVVRQGLPTLDPQTNQMVKDWIPVKLPALLLVNTFILALSSVGMELARRQIKRQAQQELAVETAGSQSDMPWLTTALILGLAFLFGQWTAWKQLAASGFYVATSPSSSFVYLLTGTHAVHLIGGVLVLCAAGMASLVGVSLVRRSIVVDITAWYWHFMSGVWIYIFCLLKVAR
jgi:cytochrome c oxidase subunit III